MADGKTNGGDRGSGVPCLKVDTGNLPGKAAFELWQEELIPHWEIKLQDSRRERFESAAESYFIGEVMLGRVRTPAQRIDRSRYRIARDGLTQYGLQFIIGGRIGRRDGEGDAQARNKGDLFVSDLTQTQALEATDLSVLYFSAPRHLLAPLLMQPDHHNQRVVSGDNHLVALLSEHLASVYKLAPHMDAAEAQALMKPMLELTAAVLNAQVTEAEADAVALATTQRIRRYIEDHVTDRLSADAVASRFGMSRRKLYYLFEPFGGFAAYVQERRLRRAHADIVDPAMQHKSLATIAQEYDFDHYPSFVRAFRRLYEMSPREIRAFVIDRGATAPSHRPYKDCSDWFFRTR